MTSCGLACRVLKPGNAGLTGSVPSNLPYPLLTATSGGPYQTITGGALGVCCTCSACTSCNLVARQYSRCRLAAAGVLGAEVAPRHRPTK